MRPEGESQFYHILPCPRDPDSLPEASRNDALAGEAVPIHETRNALPATDFCRIPPERVVELGIQIEL